MALAMATLCFCPPEMCDPFTPTFRLKPVYSPPISSIPFSFPVINDSAFDNRADYTTLSSLTFYKL